MTRIGRSAQLSVLVLMLAALSLSAAPAGADRTSQISTHVADFNLLSKSTGVSRLPLILRSPLKRMLPTAPRHLRWGKANLPESTIIAAGNRKVICFFERVKGSEGGAGSCNRRPEALVKGLTVLTVCGGTNQGAMRISGVVPNGITALGVDRHNDGTIEETIPVIENAFTVSLEAVGVVLHGVGPRAHGFAIKYPLGRLAAANGHCGSFHG